jgi:hypothetical protein
MHQKLLGRTGRIGLTCSSIAFGSQTIFLEQLERFTALRPDLAVAVCLYRVQSAIAFRKCIFKERAKQEPTALNRNSAKPVNS